jgi:hypothetical protein
MAERQVEAVVPRLPTLGAEGRAGRSAAVGAARGGAGLGLRRRHDRMLAQADGSATFAAKCKMCHDADGAGGADVNETEGQGLTSRGSPQPNSLRFLDHDARRRRCQRRHERLSGASAERDQAQ